MQKKAVTLDVDNFYCLFLDNFESLGLYDSSHVNMISRMILNFPRPWMSMNKLFSHSLSGSFENFQYYFEDLLVKKYVVVSFSSENDSFCKFRPEFFKMLGITQKDGNYYFYRAADQHNKADKS